MRSLVRDRALVWVCLGIAILTGIALFPYQLFAEPGNLTVTADGTLYDEFGRAVAAAATPPSGAGDVGALIWLLVAVGINVLVFGGLFLLARAGLRRVRPRT